MPHLHAKVQMQALHRVQRAAPSGTAPVSSCL